MIRALFERAGAVVLPWWAKWAALAVLMIAAWGVGRLQEARRGADAMAEYVGKQAERTVTIIKREVQVVTQTEIKYRDRVRTIYQQGEQLESRIPDLVTPDVDRRLPLPAGFVRVLDAAWTGDPVGPASDSDGEPAGVPPSVVAANEADNATSCRAWREQALGWREFYAGQQGAVNGRAGAWHQPGPGLLERPEPDLARGPVAARGGPVDLVTAAQVPAPPVHGDDRDVPLRVGVPINAEE
jgi:hypothetical protein